MAAPDAPLLDDASLTTGLLRTTFGVAAYFKARICRSRIFWPCGLDFGIAHADKHIASLLVSHWSYATYTTGVKGCS